MKKSPNPRPDPPPEQPYASPSRQSSHGIQHGGAWKVAYADFVTAMMALFIVLWMMSSGKEVQTAVAGYFRDPRGYTERLGAGPANSGESLRLRSRGAQSVKEQIEQALRQMPEFEKIRDHVKFSVTGEGLRIDLQETEQGLFFITGSPNPTGEGQGLLRVLGAELGGMPNRLVIEGHTDARPFRNAQPSRGYGNWELSADRANSARRLLHAYGVRSGQVAEVRGFADQQPAEEDPGSARNRRVSVVVKFGGPGV
jgi:chemotaxis protein MotB